MFLHSYVRSLFVLGISIVAAQNITVCNPNFQRDCPPIPAFSSARTIYNLNGSYPVGDFTFFSQNTIARDGDGLHITVNAIGEEPFIETNSTLVLRIYSKVF